MRQLAEKIATFRHSRTTILEPINRTSCHTSAEDGDSWENPGGHCACTRTLPVDAETCSVGTQSIKVMGNHNGHVPQKSFASFHGGVPIYPPGLRRKLDVQCMKGIWVGRLDESDWPCGAHSTGNRHWTISAQTVWKPPSSAWSGGEDQDPAAQREQM